MTTVVNLETTKVIASQSNNTVATVVVPSTVASEVVQRSVVVSGQLGPSGQNTLSDLLDVKMTATEEGDLLTKQGVYWTNTRRANVTDGGNF